MIIMYIIICLLFIGFFSGIEIAFVSANKLNIEIKKKQGKRSAKILSRFLDHPEEFIGGSLVGVNIFLVLYGLLMTNLTAPLFEKLPGVLGTNEFVHLILDTLIATMVVLILGEFIPKAFFRVLGERALSLFYIPINFFFWLLYPIAKIFVSISEFILKYLFNVKVEEKKQIFSRIDLENFVSQIKTGKSESSADLNTELFQNALHLSNVKIRECLIPRNEIVAVDKTESIQHVKETFIETKHSKILVYDGDINNIVGYLHHLDFYKNQNDLSTLIHSIPAIPETMNAVDLLNRFTKTRKSIAWVVDEFGGTAGIVTMEDLLEEIFGEIEDEHDEPNLIEKQIASNEYLFSGRLELEHLNEKFGFHFESDSSETLSGYIIENYQSIPKQKKKIIIGHYEFEIMLVTKTRIETVKLKVLDS